MSQHCASAWTRHQVCADLKLIPACSQPRVQVTPNLVLPVMDSAVLCACQHTPCMPPLPAPAGSDVHIPAVQRWWTASERSCRRPGKRQRRRAALLPRRTPTWRTWPMHFRCRPTCDLVHNARCPTATAEPRRSSQVPAWLQLPLSNLLGRYPVYSMCCVGTCVLRFCNIRACLLQGLESHAVQLEAELRDARAQPPAQQPGTTQPPGRTALSNTCKQPSLNPTVSLTGARPANWCCSVHSHPSQFHHRASGGAAAD